MLAINIENTARLFIQFIDELEVVKVLAATNDYGLAVMGVVRGKAQLVDLLEEVGIDHYTLCGDSFSRPPSLPTAYDITPQNMAKSLEEAFQTVNERPLKILRGEQLTEEEVAVRRPLSLHVFSSFTTTTDGLQRVQNWFKTSAHQN
jgi:hypothetical protein